MKFCLTAERTQRIRLDFEAEDREEANRLAGQLLSGLVNDPSKFDDGWQEREYALTDEEGWSSGWSEF